VCLQCVAGQIGSSAADSMCALGRVAGQGGHHEVYRDYAESGACDSGVVVDVLQHWCRAGAGVDGVDVVQWWCSA
jgi:hypothetical protein